jgi:SAM-dependent methyltransferase
VDSEERGRRAPDDQHERALLTLIDQLPEIYQPLYGMPQHLSSRPASGLRMDLLLGAVDKVQVRVRRPLRVLDLGAAQGYTALLLAERGHHVTGLDNQQINVDVAVALAERFPTHDARFLLGDVAHAEAFVDLRSFDVVLGLSVLHHVAYRDGHDAATGLVRRLASAVPYAVFELALPTEPLYWAEALPHDPRVTIASYAFLRELGTVPTHLSDTRRPIFFASATDVLVDGVLQPIERWFTRSHDQANETTRDARRFYVLPHSIAKLSARFGADVDSGVVEVLRDELRREAHVLESFEASGIEAPSLREFIDAPDETFLVRSSYPGTTLDQLVGYLDDAARTEITSQLLATLAELETHGLYHNDLRLWNVVWDDDVRRAALIDHGAITSVPDDCVWPQDAHFSLLLFLAALWGGRSDQTGIRVPRALNLDAADLGRLPVELLGYLMAHPRNEEVCRDTERRWVQILDAPSGSVWPQTPLAWGWLTALERQRAETALAHADVQRQLEHDRDVAGSERDAFARDRDAVIAERDALAADRLAVIVERDHLLAQARRADQLSVESAAHAEHAERLLVELAAVRNTVSWRLTAPLRFVMRAIRQI